MVQTPTHRIHTYTESDLEEIYRMCIVRAYSMNAHVIEDDSPGHERYYGTVIVVNPSQPVRLRLWNLFHELAHSRLHLIEAKHSQDQEEFEADWVARILFHRMGLGLEPPSGFRPPQYDSASLLQSHPMDYYHKRVCKGVDVLWEKIRHDIPVHIILPAGEEISPLTGIPVSPPPTPEPKTGPVTDLEGLYDDLVRKITHLGVEVKIDPGLRALNRLGRASYSTIDLIPGMDIKTQLFVLLHELTHLYLHLAWAGGYTGPEDEIEYEAVTIPYILYRHYTRGLELPAHFMNDSRFDTATVLARRGEVYFQKRADRTVKRIIKDLEQQDQPKPTQPKVMSSPDPVEPVTAPSQPPQTSSSPVPPVKPRSSKTTQPRGTMPERTFEPARPLATIIADAVATRPFGNTSDRAWKRWKLSLEYIERLHLRTPVKWYRNTTSFNENDVKEGWQSIFSIIGSLYLRWWNEAHGHDHNANESNQRDVEGGMFNALIFCRCGVAEEYHYRNFKRWPDHHRTDPLSSVRIAESVEAFWSDLGRLANLLVDDAIDQGDRASREWKAIKLYLNFYDSYYGNKSSHYKGISLYGPSTESWSYVLEGQPPYQQVRFDPAIVDPRGIVIPETVPAPMRLEYVLAQQWYKGIYLPWKDSRVLKRGLPLEQIQVEAHAFVALVMQKYGIGTVQHEKDLFAWMVSRGKYSDTVDRVTAAVRDFWNNYGAEMEL